jgi:hypothetical protein
MTTRRAFLGYVATSAALGGCTTTGPAAGPSGTWTQTADGRVAVSDPGVLGYSVTIPPGWSVAAGAPTGQAAVQLAPPEPGVATEVGIVRRVAGETPEQTAVRVARRVSPGSDAPRPAETLAPIPLRSGGGRRAQVYSIPQRTPERVIVVALVADAGAWAYQMLYTTTRAAYDRSMPLMRNLVASYRPESR